MNDLMRPSFYGSYHGVQPVQIRKDQETITADVVGPICETGDFLAKDREVPRFEPGDLVALMSAGAYGYTMSSNYNSRPRAPEVLVNGDKWAVVKTRETYEDLCRGESLPNWME
jgi:diaminopimelate decarboxylase